MAKASQELVRALRATALRLEDPSVTYRWSHFAHCNCGHLLQTLTGLSPERLAAAARMRPGDWAQQATGVARPGGQWPDFGSRPALDEGAWEPPDGGRCSATQLDMERLARELEQWGLSADDVANLERLADNRIRQRMGTSTQELHYGDRANAVGYLRAWADLLEQALGEPADFHRADTLPLAAE